MCRVGAAAHLRSQLLDEAKGTITDTGYSLRFFPQATKIN